MNAQSELTWTDRSGKELGIVVEPGHYGKTNAVPGRNPGRQPCQRPKCKQRGYLDRNRERVKQRTLYFCPSEEVVGVWSQAGSMLAYRMATQGAGLWSRRPVALDADEGRAPLLFTVTLSRINGLWIVTRFCVGTRSHRGTTLN